MERINDSRDYWDHRAETFALDTDRELQEKGDEKWTEIFRRIIRPDGAEVLDDGAGPGLFSLILSRLGHRVTSVDFSAEMVRQTVKRCAGEGYAVRGIQMDAQKLEFPDGSFDAVVTRNMIWALDHPDRAYAEIFRVLRPGGVLIMQDGNQYLYMHNEAYAAVQKEKERLGLAGSTVAQRYGPQEYDFSYIYDIAGDLPLSRTLRPAWDMDCLVDLGFDELRLSVQREGGLPMQFLIVAEKRMGA